MEFENKGRMKRTNSVISSMYHPIGNSRIKTAYCMFAGGIILICLGIGLIVTTLSPRRPSAVNNNETSVLISGPTCLAMGLVIVVFSSTDMCRYRKARNTVESELNRVISALGKPSPSFNAYQQNQSEIAPISNPKISIVINKTLWPS
ncbi:uncharacterized protein TNIN_228051 [Trichonephila inaurata madagascariensis]|uniref:Uncharacterized protein n=1 Tax=Trichonephila inaurata madagascariensis TaxID=2747483 RepID=A0A8X6WMY1_9ARAC|nr:uncharacterized protein TNIN_228051 [Trichonephila inaurata madagascariensis]